MPKRKPSTSVSITRLVFCLAILGMSLVLSSAATPAHAFAPTQPLGEMLNPDGTLNLTTGFHGSLDARGWQLISGANEPPRFAPQTAPLAVPGNQDWASNFGFRGVSSEVRGIAVDSSDNVYAGGEFTAAGGISANHVAKWKAGTWSPLSSGTNAIVAALATDATGNVYAGGGFSTAADRQSRSNIPDAFADPKAPEVSTNFVAKWNGTSWSPMGTGMNSQVWALATDGNGNVYAAGLFTTAGGTTVNGIAKWNGTAWSAVGHGFDGPVVALAVDSSNNVYAGGAFHLACDATCNPATSTQVNHTAKWNGSAWSAMGNGFDGTVLALAVDSGNNVYAGGVLTNLCAAGPGCPAGGATVNGIAKWSAGAWSAMANGFNSLVMALVVDGSNKVYAGGYFTLACGDPTCAPATSTKVSFVARWDTSAWSALGGGVNNAVRVLAHDSANNVYAGGLLTRAGSTGVSFIAKWNGSAWSALSVGDAMDDDVAISAHDSNNNLYAGGTFTTAGGVIVNHIAKWNGSVWSAMGNGLNGDVYALAVDSSNNVYAGGNFTLACDASCGPASIRVNRVAKWNGSAWSAVGNGFNDRVLTLAVDSSNNIYAGGDFTNLCLPGPGCPLGALVNRIAKLNGIVWSGMDHGFDNSVWALAVDSSNHVYAGGNFVVACDATCNLATSTTVLFIARWGGANWLSLANGLLGPVYSLAVDRGNNLYAGGSFPGTVTSLLLRNVGRWDGATWSALGNGVDDIVWGLEVDSGNNVYAGGAFTRICDANCNAATSTSANHIATWNGEVWSPLGSGVNGLVRALTAEDKTLYVGGIFTLAGGKVSARFGSVVTGQVYLPLTVR